VFCRRSSSSEKQFPGDNCDDTSEWRQWNHKTASHPLVSPHWYINCHNCYNINPSCHLLPVSHSSRTSKNSGALSIVEALTLGEGWNSVIFEGGNFVESCAHPPCNQHTHNRRLDWNSQPSNSSPQPYLLHQLATISTER
jgi:hypothetical protein